MRVQGRWPQGALIYGNCGEGRGAKVHSEWGGLAFEKLQGPSEADGRLSPFRSSHVLAA